MFQGIGIQSCINLWHNPWHQFRWSQLAVSQTIPHTAQESAQPKAIPGKCEEGQPLHFGGKLREHSLLPASLSTQQRVWACFVDEYKHIWSI